MKLFNVAVIVGTMLVPAVMPARDINSKDVKVAVVENPIAKEVRHELLMLPYLSVFDDLSFTIDETPAGAVVTLFGSTVRPVLQSSAVNVVKRIEGVESVIDKIELLPLSPFDDRIRMATFRKIYGDNILGMRYGLRANPPIRIVVSHGNIKLAGVVANEADRNLAGIRAREVAGAFTVVNELKVSKD